MSLVLTFIFATNHANNLTISKALNFQMKLAKGNNLECIEIENTLKNELSKNRPKSVKDQTLISKKVGDKYTRAQVDIRRISS